MVSSNCSQDPPRVQLVLKWRYQHHNFTISKKKSVVTKPAATVTILFFCNFNIQTYHILVTTVAISPKNMMLLHNVTRASICYYRLSTKMVKFNFERTIPLKIKPPQIFLIKLIRFQLIVFLNTEKAFSRYCAV